MSGNSTVSPWIDWEEHQFSARKPVRVVFRPRLTYTRQGRPPDELRFDVRQHIGQVLDVCALWKMGDDDPYPGEWALGAPPSNRGDVLPGILWIASGDVVLWQPESAVPVATGYVVTTRFPPSDARLIGNAATQDALYWCADGVYSFASAYAARFATCEFARDHALSLRLKDWAVFGLDDYQRTVGGAS